MKIKPAINGQSCFISPNSKVKVGPHTNIAYDDGTTVLRVPYAVRTHDVKKSPKSSTLTSFFTLKNKSNYLLAPLIF